MIHQLREGDYVPNGRGGFVRLEGSDALLMRALFRLQCRRGALPMMPELGSRLWMLMKAKPSSRRNLAMAYCTEALRELPVRVTDVTLSERDGRPDLAVYMEYEGQTLLGEVTV